MVRGDAGVPALIADAKAPRTDGLADAELDSRQDRRGREQYPQHGRHAASSCEFRDIRERSRILERTLD